MQFGGKDAHFCFSYFAAIILHVFDQHLPYHFLLLGGKNNFVNIFGKIELVKEDNHKEEKSTLLYKGYEKVYWFRKGDNPSVFQFFLSLVIFFAIIVQV